MTTPNSVASALWIAWLARWWLASPWSAKTVERQPVHAQLTYWAFFWAGAALLFFLAFGRGVLWTAIVPPSSWIPWVGVGILGLALIATGIVIKLRIRCQDMMKASGNADCLIT